MKKKLLVIIGVLLLIVLGGVLFVSMRASSLIASYKPTIEKQLSDALGARVTLGEISVSVFPGLSFSVDNVVVKGDGAAPLSVGALRARALLMPLFSKRLELSSIEVVNPRVTLLKGGDGAVVVAGLAPKQPSPGGSATSSAQPATSTEGQGMPLAIDIKSVEISDGEVVLDDKRAGTKLNVSGIHLLSSVIMDGAKVVIPSASLKCQAGNQVKIALSAKEVAFDSALQTLEMKDISLDTGGGDIRLAGALDLGKQSGDLTVRSPGVALDKVARTLQGVAPAFHAVAPSGSLGLDLKVKLAGASSPSLGGGVTLKSVGANLPGSMTVKDLSGAIAVSGPTSGLRVSSSDTSLILQGAPVKVNFVLDASPQQVIARTFEVKGFGGAITAPSSLRFDGAQPFATAPTVSALSINETLKAFAPALAPLLSGTVRSFTGDFKGALAPSPASTIQGPGNLLVVDGMLKGFNLPGVVLAKVNSLPFLEGSLQKYVPPQFQKYVTSPDTAIKELRSSFVLNGPTTSLNNLTLMSDIFTLESSGTLSSSGEINLVATILFTPEFSLALASRSDKVKRILDPQNRLVIPLALTGKAPAIVVVPNVSKLLEMGAQKAIEQKVGDLLNKKFGGASQGGAGKGLGGLFRGR